MSSRKRATTAQIDDQWKERLQPTIDALSKKLAPYGATCKTEFDEGNKSARIYPFNKKSLLALTLGSSLIITIKEHKEGKIYISCKAYNDGLPYHSQAPRNNRDVSYDYDANVIGKIKNAIIVQATQIGVKVKKPNAAEIIEANPEKFIGDRMPKTSVATHQAVAVQQPTQQTSLPTAEELRTLIAHIIQSGRSDEATRLGSSIISHCSAILEIVQEVGERTLRSRGLAAKKLRERAEQLAIAQQGFTKTRENIGDLAAPTGFLAPAITVFRAALPMFDPHKGLLQEFKAVRLEIEGSLSGSADVMGVHEDVKNELMQSHEEVMDLIAALKEGIAELEEELEGDLSFTERDSKSGVRDMFIAGLNNAQIAILCIVRNIVATQTTLGTERSFAASLFQMQSAWIEVITEMNETLQNLRTALEPELQHQEEVSLIGQFTQLNGQLADLRANMLDRASLMSAKPQTSPTETLAIA